MRGCNKGLNFYYIWYLRFLQWHNVTVFWEMTPCILAEIYQHFWRKLFHKIRLAGGKNFLPTCCKFMLDYTASHLQKISHNLTFPPTRWRSWLRHYATSRKVEGLIPDGFTGIFHWHIPSGRTMLLGSTHPPTEMSTRNISWGWRRPLRMADNLNTFMCRLSWNLGASTSCNPQGLSGPVMGLFYIYLHIYILLSMTFCVNEFFASVHNIDFRNQFVLCNICN